VLGLPAAVVPVGRSAEGLPIGVQVVGRPFHDHEVLAVAALLEQLSPVDSVAWAARDR
ncbi:MAG: amidase, partial [Pseudonocardiales bacterium]|nr:amidase [Pseudonocardiales bacterium]